MSVAIDDRSKLEIKRDQRRELVMMMMMMMNVRNGRNDNDPYIRVLK